MKNYYEILEVDKNASQEVIEKAYRALAKKYHPDLQQREKQQEFAEKMKIINEAYDILSDDFKRIQYNERLKNEELKNKTILIEEQERILQENYALKQELNRIENSQLNRQIDNGSIANMSKVLSEQINAARQQAYHDAYIQEKQNRGYKHDFKYYFKLLIAIIVIVLLCFLIYQIPVVKQFFKELYNENYIFQAIVDILKNTFSTKF